jgi:hypothetical protein
MKNYNIMNKNVLDILEEIRYTYTERYRIPELTRLICENTTEYYISDEYLKEIMSVGHEGGASYAKSYPIKPSKYKGPPDEWQEYSDVWYDLNTRLMQELGVKINALAQYYPAGGYIDWHSNWNAAGHNLIFTWSETGDGYFKYVDPKTKEIVVMPDKIGWSLKAGYFGEQGEDEFFHCAKTNCPRITISYVMSERELAGIDTEYWEEVLDYIQTE